MGILYTLSFIVRHPLNRGHSLRSVLRYFRWQVGSRLVPGPVAIPFVDTTRLLVSPGMTGATGNVYCGLHEFEDMCLVLHTLRPGDLFVDIGANIGSYTILAAGGCSAQVVAIEPLPATYKVLSDNIGLNGLTELVSAKNVGLAAEDGTLRFSRDLDTVNHVLTDAEVGSLQTVEVPVRTLDGILKDAAPTLIKIDVEGFETQVISGGTDSLRNPELIAVLMELNGSGSRYGFDESKLHLQMIELGFNAFRYEPVSRTLSPELNENKTGNTLYVRNIGRLWDRVRSAPAHNVHGVTL